MSSGQERAWRPNLLIPIEDTGTLRGDYTLIEGITRPQGAVELLGHHPEPVDEKFQNALDEMTATFRKRDNFASSAIVSTVGYREAVLTRMQTLAGQYFFRPNILFLHMPDSEAREAAYSEFVAEADRLEMGTIIYLPHPSANLGQQSSINVWIPGRPPHWRLNWDVGNLDLSLLTGYKLKANWEADLRLVTVVDDDDQVEPARDFLEKLSYRARLPETEKYVASGSFREHLSKAPHADVNIFGLVENPNFDLLREACAATDSSCLAVRSSGKENVFA